VALQTNCDQIIFEEFEFAAYRRFVGLLLFFHPSSLAKPLCYRLTE